MSFNYRLVKFDSDTPELTWYAIHAIGYSESGEVVNMTEYPSKAVGDSVEAVRETLRRMLEALDKPVLDYGLLDLEMD